MWLHFLQQSGFDLVVLIVSIYLFNAESPRKECEK
jgi:hypothetical protein